VAALAAVAVLALAACGDDDADTTAASAPPPSTAAGSGPEDAFAVVDALLAERRPDDDRMWQRAITPRLPVSWPPAADTEWVTYAYATAMDPQLADGVRVSEPFARIVETRDGVARVEPLGEIEAVDVQGVSPLTQEQLESLQGLEAATEATRGLTGEPAAGDPTAATIRAAYRAWLAVNGAIAARLPEQHADFLAWVAAGG
jgi:hypothetical protein